jgi:hypothetical protein
MPTASVDAQLALERRTDGSGFDEADQAWAKSNACGQTQARWPASGGEVIDGAVRRLHVSQAGANTKQVILAAYR